jgi:toll-like receptor 2
VLQTSCQSVVKLCIHERDFPPGPEIIANIWNKLECSRKVILVVSKNFTDSQYCNYEMNLARLRSVEKGCNVLVPVILEWPDVEQVSECLHWSLRKVTYIRWSDTPWSDREGEQDDFWHKLREALAIDT